MARRAKTENREREKTTMRDRETTRKKSCSSPLMDLCFSDESDEGSEWQNDTHTQREPCAKVKRGALTWKPVRLCAPGAHLASLLFSHPPSPSRLHLRWSRGRFVST